MDKIQGLLSKTAGIN